jgi:hypothetical protein
MVETQWINWD